MDWLMNWLNNWFVRWWLVGWLGWCWLVDWWIDYIVGRFVEGCIVWFLEVLCTTTGCTLLAVLAVLVYFAHTLSALLYSGAPYRCTTDCALLLYCTAMLHICFIVLRWRAGSAPLRSPRLSISGRRSLLPTGPPEKPRAWILTALTWSTTDRWQGTRNR